MDRPTSSARRAAISLTYISGRSARVADYDPAQVVAAEIEAARFYD